MWCPTKWCSPDRPTGAAAGGASALLLAGRSWGIRDIDWTRRVIQVEPVDSGGVAKWRGHGAPMGRELASGIREILLGRLPGGVELSSRAEAKLTELRADASWAQPSTTTLVDTGGRVTWWTFAGTKANLRLAQAVAEHRTEVLAIDDLTISLDPRTTASEIRASLDSADFDSMSLPEHVLTEAAKRLKFSECLPGHLAATTIGEGLSDGAAFEACRAERIASYVGL